MSEDNGQEANANSQPQEVANVQNANGEQESQEASAQQDQPPLTFEQKVEEKILDIAQLIFGQRKFPKTSKEQQIIKVNIKPKALDKNFQQLRELILESAADNGQESIESLTARIQELKESHAQEIQTKEQNCQQEKSQLQAILEELKANQATLRQQIERLQIVQRDQLQQIESMKGNEMVLRSEKERGGKERKGLEDRINELMAQVQELQQSEESYTIQIAELKEEREEIVAEKINYQQEIADMEDKIEDLSYQKVIKQLDQSEITKLQNENKFYKMLLPKIENAQHSQQNQQQVQQQQVQFISDSFARRSDSFAKRSKSRFDEKRQFDLIFHDKQSFSYQNKQNMSQRHRDNINFFRQNRESQQLNMDISDNEMDEQFDRVESLQNLKKFRHRENSTPVHREQPEQQDLSETQRQLAFRLQVYDGQQTPQRRGSLKNSQQQEVVSVKNLQKMLSKTQRRRNIPMNTQQNPVSTKLLQINQFMSPSQIPSADITLRESFYDTSPKMKVDTSMEEEQATLQLLQRTRLRTKLQKDIQNTRMYGSHKNSLSNRKN